MGVVILIFEFLIFGGFIDSFIMLIGGVNLFVIIIGIMFMYILVVNLVFWVLGVNYVVMYVVKNKDLLVVFGKINLKNDMLMGISILNGIVVFVLIVVVLFILNENIFWVFFVLNVVVLLGLYILMFLVFLKLCKVDLDWECLFKVLGGKILFYLMIFVLMILFIIILIFFVVLLNGLSVELNEKILILIGIVVVVIVGEICIWFVGKRKDKGEIGNENDW